MPSYSSFSSEDDLGEFLDANMFSFGSDGMEIADGDLYDLPLKTGVKFDPMVTILGGGQVPIAAGDGFWDTLQYECTGLDAVGRRGSLSLNDLEGPEGSMGDSASISLGDIGSPGDIDVRGGGIKEQIMNYMSKVFRGDSDDDLLVDNDDMVHNRAANLPSSLEENSKSNSRLVAPAVPNSANSTAAATASGNATTATTSNLTTNAALTLQ
jgi:hypothetical protein